MKPEEFQAALRRAGHPLFKMLSKTSHIADHAERELAMERYFFTEYLPSRTKNLCPACAEYFRDQLDMINAKNAWLSHGGQAEQRGRETEYYIKAGGKVSDSDFADIARAPNVLAAARIIEERMRQRLNPEKLDSPYGLSTAIKHALLKKYNRYRIARPLSVWSYFYFAEELDAMIADVKNAVYCGVTCSTIDVVQRRFIGPGS